MYYILLEISTIFEICQVGLHTWTLINQTINNQNNQFNQMMEVENRTPIFLSRLEFLPLARLLIDW